MLCQTCGKYHNPDSWEARVHDLVETAKTMRKQGNAGMAVDKLLEGLTILTEVMATHEKTCKQIILA